MSIEIPDSAVQKLRHAKLTGDRLYAIWARKANQVWTKEQDEWMRLQYQVLCDTHDALWEIVNANLSR